jgi:CO/xanthine dehydrogenase FAD-binding subunit
MSPYSEYHRPTTLDAALALLSRASPPTRPLAGGTHSLRGILPQQAVVDLVDLPLSGIKRAGPIWHVGATTTLEALRQAQGLPPALQRAAHRQASRNVRLRATAGGAVAAADSGPLLACLLALRAQVHLEPNAQTVGLAEFLAGQSAARWNQRLIVAVSFDSSRCVGLAEVARTPADTPLLCVAVGATPAGQVLSQVAVAAGAVGQPLATCPQTARWLEAQSAKQAAGPTPERVVEAIAWKDDVRGSAQYRQALLPELVQRAWTELRSLCGEASHES